MTVSNFASVLFSTESALLVMATLLLLVSHLFRVRLRQYRQWQAHCTHIERQIRDLDRLIHRHWVLYLTHLHRGVYVPPATCADARVGEVRAHRRGDTDVAYPRPLGTSRASS